MRVAYMCAGAYERCGRDVLLVLELMRQGGCQAEVSTAAAAAAVVTVVATAAAAAAAATAAAVTTSNVVK